MNGDGLNLSAFDIEGLELATDLVDDRVVIRAGVAHVPLRFVCELPNGVGVGIVEKQIRRTVVAIGNKGNVSADPHRVLVGRIDVRNLLERAAGGIDDPQRWCIAAAVLAPATYSDVGEGIGSIRQALTVR